MQKKSRLLMVGGTMACALGIGFVMQNTSQPSAGNQPVTPDVVLAAPVKTETLQQAEPEVQLSGITLTSAQPPVADVTPRREPGALPETPRDPQTPRLGCQTSLDATPVKGANVRINIKAPCLSNERLTLHHSGLMFTASTDQQGSYSVTIPVLAPHAVFIVDFENGPDMVTTAMVPDLGDYDRVAVQWSGKAGFEIHAREFGAGYGEQGHSWSGLNGAQNSEGRVVRLGEPAGLSPLMAEVYSFPRAASSRNGQVTLSVETEVTAENCGRDVSAQSLELRNGDTLRTRDMVLSVPNCSAIGDFLVLNNLVEDLKIAAR
jgi:hypothetical protein